MFLLLLAIFPSVGAESELYQDWVRYADSRKLHEDISMMYTDDLEFPT